MANDQAHAGKTPVEAKKYSKRMPDSERSSTDSGTKSSKKASNKSEKLSSETPNNSLCADGEGTGKPLDSAVGSDHVQMALMAELAKSICTGLSAPRKALMMEVSESLNDNFRTLTHTLLQQPSEDGHPWDSDDLGGSDSPPHYPGASASHTAAATVNTAGDVPVGVRDGARG